jgi:hypothetical protein
MTRELEWRYRSWPLPLSLLSHPLSPFCRALFRSEQSQATNLPHESADVSHHHVSSRLASHRSLPDSDSENHLPKVPYERKSHTERREKKNKHSVRNLPKIPKKWVVFVVAAVVVYIVQECPLTAKRLITCSMTILWRQRGRERGRVGEGMTEENHSLVRLLASSREIRKAKRGREGETLRS